MDPLVHEPMVNVQETILKLQHGFEHKFNIYNFDFILK